MEKIINGKMVKKQTPYNLAEEKCNKEQIEMCFKAVKKENWQTQFD